MRRTLAKIAVLALPFCLPAAAMADQENPTGQTAEAAPATSDPLRMICRRIEVIGSRLQRRRVCMTAAEWDALHASDRQGLERTQNARWKSE